jgi:hypothetical protein
VLRISEERCSDEKEEKQCNIQALAIMCLTILTRPSTRHHYHIHYVFQFCRGPEHTHLVFFRCCWLDLSKATSLDRKRISHSLSSWHLSIRAIPRREKEEEKKSSGGGHFEVAVINSIVSGYLMSFHPQTAKQRAFVLSQLC